MILLTSDIESDFISLKIGNISTKAESKTHVIIGVDKHFMIIPLIIQTSIHIFVIFI